MDSVTSTRLVLGGTFDPIHYGHLRCARAAADALGIQTVVLIPNHVPPLKRLHPSPAPADERLGMCRLAISDLAGFEVDDRELRRTGPSYTIDTVRELKQAGWAQVPWLIGADQLPYLHKWHEPHALLSEALIYVTARPGFDIQWSTMSAEVKSLIGRVVLTPPVDISSTEIRRRVHEGVSIDGLTPPAVCRYIRERGLYL